MKMCAAIPGSRTWLGISLPLKVYGGGGGTGIYKQSRPVNGEAEWYARRGGKSTFILHTCALQLRPNLLEGGDDLRTIQELLGHSDVRTTMIYTHVLDKGGRGVRSPLEK